MQQQGQLGKKQEEKDKKIEQLGERMKDFENIIAWFKTQQKGNYDITIGEEKDKEQQPPL
jgi:archaellum component FlaC